MQLKYKGAKGKSLESYKFFPLIAWAVTIGFALFVYNLSLDLKDTVSEIQLQTELTQQLLLENLERQPATTTPLAE